MSMPFYVNGLSRGCRSGLGAGVLCVLSSLGVFLAGPVVADDASVQKAYDIAARADRSDTGFADSEVEASMVLRNAAGQESQRSLRFLTLERANEDVGDKSLVIFNSPRDVEGTALLSHANILEADDQWLYLPALKRVRRISSANKDGAFLGSEFAFEDFTALELKKFTYDYVGEGELTVRVNGAETTLGMDIIERIPAYENSGYSRQISYVDQEIFQVHKVEYFDRRGDLIKVLELKDYREYGEGIWRAQTLSMTNTKTNKSTDLVYGEYQFNKGLDDNDFVRGVLTRLR